MIRVLLVDDQKLVRQGFVLMLSVEDDIEVVGQAGTGAEAIDLAEQLRPDVILMDVQMPVLDGIAATAEVVARGLGRVVILTTFDRDDYLFDGLAAGASGFLLKNTDPEHLVETVRAAVLGHALLAPEVTLRVMAEGAVRTVLSYVPVISSILMPVRLFEGDAQWWDAALALLLNLAFAAFTVWLGSQMYRPSLLQVNGQVKLADALRGGR